MGSFEHPPVPTLTSITQLCRTLCRRTLKDPGLRPPDDKYGRYMTTFRKMHTQGDTVPLAVVSGEPFRIGSEHHPPPTSTTGDKTAEQSAAEAARLGQRGRGVWHDPNDR